MVRVVVNLAELPVQVVVGAPEQKCRVLLEEESKFAGIRLAQELLEPFFERRRFWFRVRGRIRGAWPFLFLRVDEWSGHVGAPGIPGRVKVMKVFFSPVPGGCVRGEGWRRLRCP